jgi:Rrf2 family nitric oxide-sensitive transcriptional repressor
VISPACGLRGVLDEALRGFLAVLDRYSLADLVANPGSVRRMRRLLSDPVAIEARP